MEVYNVDLQARRDRLFDEAVVRTLSRKSVPVYLYKFLNVLKTEVKGNFIFAPFKGEELSDEEVKKRCYDAVTVFLLLVYAEMRNDLGLQDLVAVKIGLPYATTKGVSLTTKTLLEVRSYANSRGGVPAYNMVLPDSVIQEAEAIQIVPVISYEASETISQRINWISINRTFRDFAELLRRGLTHNGEYLRREMPNMRVPVVIDDVTNSLCRFQDNFPEKLTNASDLAAKRHSKWVAKVEQRLKQDQQEQFLQDEEQFPVDEQEYDVDLQDIGNLFDPSTEVEMDDDWLREHAEEAASAPWAEIYEPSENLASTKAIVSKKESIAAIMEKLEALHKSFDKKMSKMFNSLNALEKEIDDL